MTRIRTFSPRSQRGATLLRCLLACVALFSFSLAQAGNRHDAVHSHEAKARHQRFAHNPLIFVHGGAGSASQFASQAMRLTSNGYPQSHLHALEYDSSFAVDTMESIHARLDALIERVKEQTGKAQVDLMGHSMGTRVSQLYLASPERAANIGHYVNLDGYPAEAPPGGVPTRAIWAGISLTDRGVILGADNVTVPGQTHVEVATSAETFALFYEFFTDMEAETTAVLPEPSGRVKVAGRTTFFPQNTGVAGATLEIYSISGHDGQRLKKRPAATYVLDESGEWGPFRARRGSHYEFVIVREGQNHHIYKEPFIRDDYFVRLQTSPVGDGVGANMDTSPQQTNLVVSRDKEFLGDLNSGNDILAINGINVVNAFNSPLSNRTTAMYFYDAGSDGVTELLEPIPYFHALPFITGSDLFIPADEQAQGRVRLTMIARGSNGLMQVINLPNWPSHTDRVSVLFNDFVQWDNVPLPYWVP